MSSERRIMISGRRAVCLAAALLGLGVVPVSAADLEVSVVDHKGRPVAEAVVVALSLDSTPTSDVDLPEVVIDQIDKQFVPYVTAVPVGTAIRFPNLDDIRHHVYSFSPAKKFELPLYEGIPAEPVIFDEPGTIVLGCNIHDWMAAYIYVLETPYFALTGETGTISLTGLPVGSYDLRVEHPRSKNEAETIRVEIGATSSSPVTFELTLKPDFRRARAPRSGEREY